MTNIESDNVTIIPVYGVIFNNGVIYRLQLKTTLANDSGVKTTSSWATYNYQLDSIAPYTRSIDFGSSPAGIVLNDKVVTFGVALGSKNVHFIDIPDSGVFNPLSGDVITNSNGITSLTYETNYYSPTDPAPDSEYISITSRVDGSSTTVYGSQYVWDRYDLSFYKRFRTALNNLTQMPTWSGGVPGPGSSLYCDTHLTQVSGVNTSFYLKSLSKFQFPGGDWVLTNPPSSAAFSVVQLLKVTSTDNLSQVSNTISSISPLTQVSGVSDFYQMSQLYVSRHLSSGHKDTAIIDQFQFIVDAVPAFWSEKNAVDTNIWIKLRPFAFSLNQSSLVFKVREMSYAGDTGYVDVTSLCSITTFDAGGGMLGLIIDYNPAINFHHNSVVYVSIEVYDVALTPNIILTDYWFRIIPDYRAPYIENEIPDREEEDVSVFTNIEFDVMDAGEGVDISSLVMYVNNRLVYPTTSGISVGYRVFYNPPADFYYGEHVEIFVNIRDIGGNLLHDAWRFYCAGSTGPWIDRDSFSPIHCSKGVFRKVSGISVNVYAVDGTGVDPDSILVTIGGKDRNVSLTPIIYRID
jgi:hypothetical protein